MPSLHAIERVERFIAEAEEHERADLHRMIAESEAFEKGLDELLRELRLMHGYLTTLDAVKGDATRVEQAMRHRYGSNALGFGGIRGQTLEQRLRSARNALVTQINHEDPRVQFIHKQLLEQIDRMLREVDIVWQQHLHQREFAA